MSDNTKLNYSECCSYTESVCGEWKKTRKHGLFDLESLDRNVEQQLGM